MTALSVNLNKVALMRNARAGRAPGPHARPSVERAGRACLAAGAAGLTLHPRPDRRHALPADARALAEIVREAGAELNLEGNPFSESRDDGPGFLDLLREVAPTQATLVPDGAGQLTSDHGWRPADAPRLAPVVAELQGLGCRVALFVDATPEAVDGAAEAGADRVELYTGPYAAAALRGEGAAAAAPYAAAAERARAAGLGVNAGHDLDADNVAPFLRVVPGVAEVSIGQALVADALHVGLAAAVGAYLEAIRSAGG